MVGILHITCFLIGFISSIIPHFKEIAKENIAGLTDGKKYGMMFVVRMPDDYLLKESI